VVLQGDVCYLDRQLKLPFQARKVIPDEKPSDNKLWESVHLSLKVHWYDCQKARGFWWSFSDATPGGPGWAFTQYYMQKLVYVQFCSLGWSYSVKWGIWIRLGPAHHSNCFLRFPSIGSEFAFRSLSRSWRLSPIVWKVYVRATIR
jgi:hypothetical protein